MTDYRKQIDLELLKLISYHEKEYTDYVSEGGSIETELNDNLENIEDNEPLIIQHGHLNISQKK